jgi:NADPH2:quinone reductase
MTHTMTGIVIEGGKGPASALRPEAMPRPTPKPGEILVKIHAAGLNWPDIGQRTGGYPVPPDASPIMGLEIAGEVVEAVGRWKVGDKVCALLGGGGYAEYVALDARHALPIPDGFDMLHAAALPETIFTVWANVFENGRLQAGETLLVHGATSGIGTTAIQMGKAAGARVIATARTAAKTAMARELGADIAIDTSVEDFAQVVTREGGCDVVCEIVGGDFFLKDLEALKFKGRIAFIAAQAGGDVNLPIRILMQKHAQVTGSTLRPRGADEKARLAAAIEATVWPWVQAGRIRPQIAKVYPLTEAAAAHAHFESRQHDGKIMLSMV